MVDSRQSDSPTHDITTTKGDPIHRKAIRRDWSRSPIVRTGDPPRNFLERSWFRIISPSSLFGKLRWARILLHLVTSR